MGCLLARTMLVSTDKSGVVWRIDREELHTPPLITACLFSYTLSLEVGVCFRWRKFNFPVRLSRLFAIFNICLEKLLLCEYKRCDLLMVLGKHWDLFLTHFDTSSVVVIGRHCPFFLFFFLVSPFKSLLTSFLDSTSYLITL